MNLRSTLVHRPAKAMLRSVLRRLGHTIIPCSRDASDSWMGLSARPIRTVLDIGACRGGFARSILLPRFPEAVVHSFEPSPTAFAALRTVADASQGRILAHNVGLGESAGRLSFNSAIDSLPSSSLLPSTALNGARFPRTARTETLEVEISVLDEIAPMLAIRDDLLVKIDVQGYEDRVIRGGRKTISRAVACIVEVQVAELYGGQPSFRDIFILMDELGFRFEGVLEQHSAPDGGTLYLDAVFLR